MSTAVNVRVNFRTYLAQVSIDAVEPRTELFVLLSVFPEGVHSITNDTHAHAIGEPFDKCSKFAHRLVEGFIVCQRLVRILAVTGDSTSVLSVLFEEVEEPTDGLLVVLVLLALDDNLQTKISDVNYGVTVSLKNTYLLASINELIAPLLREVILAEEALSPVVMLVRLVFMLVRAILVLLRNTVEEIIL